MPHLGISQRHCCLIPAKGKSGPSYTAPMPTPALTVDDLVIRRAGRAVVDHATFIAPAGAVTALVGPNGAGKTTTVEACVGLLRPDEGGIEIATDEVSVMLQDGGLYPTARPGQLARYVASLYDDPLEPDDVLRRVGLDPGMKATIRRMSGGEQQRLKAALALIGRPRLAFLDEPTAGLDSDGRVILHDLIRELVDAGSTVVITTHLMDDVEALADHLVVMKEGRIAAEGSVDTFVGTGTDIWITSTHDVDSGSLPFKLDRVTASTYVVHDCTRPEDLATIASWCAQESASIEHIGRRPLASAVAEILAAGKR